MGSTLLPIDSRAEQSVLGTVPLLKWAGGKRALASQIIDVLAHGEGAYFEPFLGGGAIFFRLRPEVAYLSDINSELIECYEAIRDFPKDLSIRLARMKNSEADYYHVRQSKPRSTLGRAARFIYLTTLSFNGLYRQNLRGEFNVPYGYKVGKQLPDLSKLLSVSSILSNAQLTVADFQEATSTAVQGDTVYFDPPYTVAHNNNGFVKYNKAIFSWNDQIRLAEHATELANRGCRVIVSNADHYSVRDLYRNFETRTVYRSSVIAASAKRRGQISECLFISR